MKISNINNVLQNLLIILSLLAISPLGTITSLAQRRQTNQKSQYDPCEVFGNCIEGVDNYANTSASNSVISIVLNVVYFLIYVGGAIAVLFIVIGAYNMITGGGDDAKVKAGRQTFSNAVIGLVLAIISVSIVSIITRVVPGLRV
jgi:hypothetical protein